MSNQKKRARTWGYEIVVKTDTDFKEKWARGYIEKYIDAMRIATENFKHRADVKFKWRELQDDEVPEI
jgi:hypothetical protein